MDIESFQRIISDLADEIRSLRKEVCILMSVVQLNHCINYIRIYFLDN